MTVIFADRGHTSKIERLADGSVRVMARLARDGVQTYAPWPGSKIQGRPIRIYRPKSEVFADSSLKTLKGTAVTVGHPPERSVSPGTWKKYAVGHNEGEYRAVDGGDGAEYVETPIVVSDQETINSVVRDRDLVEISQGYGVDLEWTSGVTDAGEQYDAIQRRIVHNHTALLGVGEARAGQGARVLLDSSESRERPKMDEEEKKLFAQKIVQMTMDAIDSRASAKEAAAKEAAEREAKLVADAKEAAKKEMQEELAKKEADSAELSEKELAKKEASELLAADSQEQKLLLADTRDAAKAMLPPDYEFEGKTAREIQCDALNRHLPAYKPDGKSDAHVLGAFDVLKSNKTKYVADSTNPSQGTRSNSLADHTKDYHVRMDNVFEDAWKELS